jgi:dipeptidyl aminopeptidase/acylaminoacyl peptidase
MRQSKWRLVPLVLALWVTSAAAETETGPPRRIPTADLAARPAISGLQLSPDGLRAIGRVVINGKTELAMHNFAENVPLKSIAIPAKHDLRWYRWAGNGRVLISLAQTVPWYGDEVEATRLVSYDFTTGTARFIGQRSEGLEGDDVLYVDKSGDWLLLSVQKSIFDYPTVYRVDLATGKLDQVVGARDDVWEWYAGDDGVVRAGVGFGTSSWSMIYRKTAAERFRTVGRARYGDEDAALDILRFVQDSDEGYVLDNKATGRYGLYRYNFATKERGELVLAHDTNDITDFSTGPDGKLSAAWFTDERDRIVWFDDNMKARQAEIDGAIKGNENWITSRSADDKAMLVWTGASNNPGAIYIYRPEYGRMNPVYRVNDKLKPAELAPVRYVHYKARDGLDIPAYLTLPVGRPAKNLPLIILPHGGPYYVRDNSDFDAEVQFLANRGYAVLQPNYRGSEGYGKAYYEKGEGQWGRQMQDDLDDGMDWLAHDGVIDPKRACIVGGSYGGYAALWGATRNPERYRCAASFAGVSDLGRQLKYQLDFRINRRYRKDWRRIVQGGPDIDPRAFSPLFAIDRLKVPVLLMHGDADQTVPYRQSKLYADALTKAGKVNEFYTLAGEGHGFSNSDNLKAWLDRLDAFLAKYNPAG